jgi:tellurite resistance protein TerC
LESIGTPASWIAFAALVLAVLALDLGVFQRRAHEVRLREALVWTAVWIALSLLFALGVYARFGAETSLQFLTGYLIEKALSVDNLFVFFLVFSTFAVPPKLQHRVLFWGIIGALLTRAFFIFLGAAIIHRFHWTSYLLGGFLIFSGIRLLRKRGEEIRPERNSVFRVFRRIVPSVSHYNGDRFTVVEMGRRHATPLLLVLVAIEATDIVFAVDSVPAVFAVTTDPFIVYTSNVFAVLGMRALYFVLAGMIGRFYYLNVALSLLLVLVGAKMLLAAVYTVPTLVSLSAIVVLLASSILASFVRSRRLPSETH